MVDQQRPIQIVGSVQKDFQTTMMRELLNQCHDCANADEVNVDWKSLSQLLILQNQSIQQKHPLVLHKNHNYN